MVFIKLQFKDNIKKILIAKEEISWQKICEILHSIFKLGDSNSIHLVYEDEEEAKTIEIKSNSELLETINKKLLKQFIKFFVFYSGAVEADIAFTSLTDVNQSCSSSQPLDSSRRAKKKKPKKDTNEIISSSSNNSSSQSEHKESEKSCNALDKGDVIPDIVEDTTTTTQPAVSPSQKLNSLIEVESGEHLKNILSKAINKSQVFEEIKGKIRQFITENKSSNEATSEKTADIIEYQVQTNLQHLSDLFVQNIRDVLDDEMLKQLNGSEPSKKQLSLDVNKDGLEVDSNKSLPRNDGEQQTLKLSPARNTITPRHTYPSAQFPSLTEEDAVLCDQEESVYECDVQTKKPRKHTTDHGKMLELIQEQHDQSIINIENALLQSQRVSEAQICQTFEQSYKSIRHLFDSMAQKSHKKPISALELRLLLDKQVQQYSLLDSYSDETPTQQVSTPQAEKSNSFDDTIVQVIAPLHSFENEKIFTQTTQFHPAISAGLIPEDFQVPLNNNIDEDLEQIQNMPALIMTKKISHSFVSKV